MANRPGPKPTPTPLKIVKGETRPCRTGDPEPEPLKEDLGNPPDRLDADGKRVWRELARECWWATTADRLAAEFLSAALGEWRRLRREIKAEPVYRDSRKRIVVRDPRVAAMKDAEKRANALLVEFGLTPSSRTRVKAPAREVDDPGAEFFT